MGSHSVTCHPTVAIIPPLPPAEASTRFSNPGGMQGSVDLCYVKADWPGIEPATCKSQVQRPTADPPPKTQKMDFNAQQWCGWLCHHNSQLWPWPLTSSPESNQVISSRGCWQQQKTKDEGGGYKYLSATWVECLKRAVVHHGVFSKLRVPIL